jgi:hypothetical protein
VQWKFSPPKEQSHDRPHLRNLQRAAQQHGRAHRALRHVLRQARWQHEVGADNDYGSKAMTDKAQGAAELLPCPFCSGAARIESNRDWHRLYADHDENCLFDNEDEMLMFPAQPGYLAEIAELWNRRAVLKAQPAPTEAMPKLVIALPDYEQRRLVIVSDEMIDGERVVCAAIKPAPTEAPRPDLSKFVTVEQWQAAMSQWSLNKALGKGSTEAQGDRHALQAEGTHPAPCARHCEATAFGIEIRRLEAENAGLRAAQGEDSARLDAEQYRPIGMTIGNDKQHGWHVALDPGETWNEVGHHKRVYIRVPQPQEPSCPSK